LDELEGEPTQAKFQRALNRRLKILDVKVQGLTALFAECKIQGELPALVTEIGRTRLKFWRAATSAIPLAPRDRVAADSAFEHLLRQLTSLIIRINQLKP
ncbi:MAG TPA: hypothetical protein VN461_12350, partial [Vicinamibacteria bacterium]|nr:hypothetical protein [Vicinamibacteria bacterium]